MSGISSPSIGSPGTHPLALSATPVETAAGAAGSTSVQHRDADITQVPSPAQNAPLPGMSAPQPFRIRDLLGLIKNASDEELKYLTLQAGTETMRVTGRLAQMYAILRASGNALAAELKRKAAEELESRAELQLFAGVMQGGVDLAGSAASLVTAFNGGRKGVQEAAQEGNYAKLQQEGRVFLENEYLRSAESAAQTTKSSIAPDVAGQQDASSSASSASDSSSTQREKRKRENDDAGGSVASTRRSLSGEEPREIHFSPTEVNTLARRNAKAPSASSVGDAEQSHSDRSARARDDRVSESDDADVSGLECDWEVEYLRIQHEDMPPPGAAAHGNSGVGGMSQERTQASHARARDGASDLAAERSVSARHSSTSSTESVDSSTSDAASRSADRSRRATEKDASQDDDADLSGLDHDWEAEYMPLRNEAAPSVVSAGEAGNAAHTGHGRSADKESYTATSDDTTPRTSATDRDVNTRVSSTSSTEPGEGSTSESSSGNGARKRAADQEAPDSHHTDKRSQKEDTARVFRKPKPRFETHGYDENGWTPAQHEKADGIQKKVKELRAESTKYGNYSMAFSAGTNGAGNVIGAPLTAEAEKKQAESQKLEALAQHVQALIDTLSQSEGAQVQVFERTLEMMRTFGQNNAENMKLSA